MPYEVITSLPHDTFVHDILKLKQNEALISSNYQTSIEFWDSNNYKKFYSIKGHYIEPYGTTMIELPNGLIAISSYTSPYPNYCDPISFSIIKEIKNQEYISSSSSICVLDNHSFIFIMEK